MDEFDLSVIRRIVHGYYARNESFSFKKLPNKLRDEIHFLYSITALSLVLKMLGFKYKKRQRESIVRERADLVAWRESFVRRIQEIRKNEPDREIVCTDKTWLNAGHRIKKEWVDDLEAFQNPHRSVADYGTVGCTKDLMGRGKRLIIVDCITENGPIPGALWTFSTSSKTKREEKHDLQFIETAVAEEGDRENENSDQKQEDQMQKNKALASGKSKVNENSSDQHSTKKTKVDDVRKNNSDENIEREEDGTRMHDFDYHDTINAESYEKYFENICKLFKPNSIIIIDNASYLSRNTVSKWRKAQFQSWLTENKIPFKPDALRSELWTLCKKYRRDKTSKVIDNIAKKNGQEVIRLPPYHCDLNAIELIWADEKNYVSRENREMTL